MRIGLVPRGPPSGSSLPCCCWRTTVPPRSSSAASTRTVLPARAARAGAPVRKRSEAALARADARDARRLGRPRLAAAALGPRRSAWAVSAARSSSGWSSLATLWLVRLPFSDRRPLVAAPLGPRALRPRRVARSPSGRCSARRRSSRWRRSRSWSRSPSASRAAGGCPAAPSSSRSRRCSSSSRAGSRAAGDIRSRPGASRRHRADRGGRARAGAGRVMEVSDWTDQANAFAAGFGPSTRVVVWDTLLDGRFSRGEIDVVRRPRARARAQPPHRQGHRLVRALRLPAALPRRGGDPTARRAARSRRTFRSRCSC